MFSLPRMQNWKFLLSPMRNNERTLGREILRSPFIKMLQTHPKTLLVREVFSALGKSLSLLLISWKVRAKADAVPA